MCWVIEQDHLCSLIIYAHWLVLVPPKETSRRDWNKVYKDVKHQLTRCQPKTRRMRAAKLRLRLFLHRSMRTWTKAEVHRPIDFDLVLYVAVNIFFSVMSGRVFLFWTSTKQGLICLAQGHNAVKPMGLEHEEREKREKKRKRKRREKEDREKKREGRRETRRERERERGERRRRESRER